MQFQMSVKGLNLAVPVYIVYNEDMAAPGKKKPRRNRRQKPKSPVPEEVVVVDDEEKSEDDPEALREANENNDNEKSNNNSPEEEEATEATVKRYNEEIARWQKVAQELTRNSTTKPRQIFQYMEKGKRFELVEVENFNPPNVTLPMLKSVLSTTVPTTKLTKKGQIDWSQYDGLIMYHTRKAGGSSLWTWAKEVAKKHGLFVRQVEGDTYDPTDPRYHRRRVLVFTILRPPVDRVISSYEYDGIQTWNHAPKKDFTEWVQHCQSANYKDKPGIWIPVPSKDERKIFRALHKPIPGFYIGWLWLCASECYSKLFGGWPKSKPDPLQATKNLDNIEIVWMKNLKNPDYTQWLKHRFDAEDIDIIHKRATKAKEKKQYNDTEKALAASENVQDNILYQALLEKWTKMTNLPLQ